MLQKFGQIDGYLVSDLENTHYVVNGTSEFEVENFGREEELCGKSKFERWFNI